MKFMSRILLKELLDGIVTEQAPQPPPTPPTATGTSPMPGPAAPQVPTPEAPAPEGGDTPTPEDPGEYDFTKDFKIFESSIEKAKQAAKKKFLDKMNQFVKDKKVTANASRGYGQPQKDYTIDKVVKASVDWYYNKNVVVLTDENGKEFFLTPGVNVKVEALPSEEPEAQGQDQAPAEPPKMKAPEPAPTAATGTTPPPGGPGGQPGQAPTGTGTTPPPGQEPGQEPQPDQEQPAEEPAPEDPNQVALKKKKKVATPAPAMAEEVVEEATTPVKADDVRDIGNLIYDFIPVRVQDSMGRRFDVRKYFKGGKTEGSYEGWTTEYRIEIPENVFGGQLDIREFKLEATDYMRHYSGPGEAFSRGYVEVTKHGRFYVFDFSESGGLDM